MYDRVFGIGEFKYAICSLPPTITSLPSLGAFKRALKTELFCRSVFGKKVHGKKRPRKNRPRLEKKGPRK